MRLRWLAVLASVLSLASPAVAQDNEITGTIDLELNKASETSEGGCQIVFFGRNGLNKELEDVSWRLAVFDGEGIFQNLLSLPLGKLSSGKRRVIQYNLPTPCDQLSEIIINDVDSCKIKDLSSDSSEVCLTKLVVSSRANVALGL